MRLTWCGTSDITFVIPHSINSNSRNGPEEKAFAPCDELLYASLFENDRN